MDKHGFHNQLTVWRTNTLSSHSSENQYITNNPCSWTPLQNTDYEQKPFVSCCMSISSTNRMFVVRCLHGDVRREYQIYAAEWGSAAQMSVEKSRCALTKCLPGRGIRVACAHVVRRNAEVRRSELLRSGYVRHGHVRSGYVRSIFAYRHSIKMHYG